MLCNALMVFGNLGIKAMVAVRRLIFAEDDTQSVPSHGVRQTRHRGRNHPGPGGRPPAPPAGRPGGRDGRGAGRRGHRGGLPGQISHQTWGLQLWDLDNEKVPSFQYFDKGIFFNLRFLPEKILNYCLFGGKVWKFSFVSFDISPHNQDNNSNCVNDNIAKVLEVYDEETCLETMRGETQ